MWLAMIWQSKAWWQKFSDLMWTDVFLKQRSRTSLQISSHFPGWFETFGEDKGGLWTHVKRYIFRNAALRKLNDLIKRARLAKVRKEDYFVIVFTHTCPISGSRLHHLQFEEGHAKCVWKGEEAEGTDQGSGCIVSLVLLNKCKVSIFIYVLMQHS